MSPYIAPPRAFSRASVFFALILLGCQEDRDRAEDLASPADLAAPADPPAVRFKVTVVTDGDGIITSTPAGIACGSQCSAEFPRGTRVVLHASANRRAYFGGWSGACSGSDTCALEVTQTLQLAAHFAPRVCLSSGWCWENPLPQGQAVVALWGSSADNVYAGAGGSILRWNGSTWQAMETELRLVDAVTDLWGSGADDVWATVSPRSATGPNLLHFDGVKWSRVDPGIAQPLRGVRGRGRNDVYAVGPKGLVLHWDGSSWQSATASDRDLYSVWIAGPNDVLAAGDSVIVRWNGTAWTQVFRQSTNTLLFARMWGTDSSNIFAGAYDPYPPNKGVVLRWNGAAWKSSVSGLPIHVNDLWGTSGQDIYVVGDSASGTSTALFRFDGAMWQPVPVAGSAELGLRAIWGAGPQSLFLGTTAGPILHGDGATWRSTSGPLARVSAVWGLSTGETFAATAKGVLYRDGGTWRQMPGTESFALSAIWGLGARDVYAVGAGGAIIHWDGASWQKMTSPVTSPLRGIWGSDAAHVYAVGQSMTLLRKNGAAWERITLPGDIIPDLNSISGSGSSHILAVGTGGTLVSFDGTAWKRTALSPYKDLYAVWTAGPAAAFIGGNTGTILRWNGATWSTVPVTSLADYVAVSGNGPDDVVIGGTGGGPMMLRWNGTSFSAVEVQGAIVGLFGTGGRDYFAAVAEDRIMSYQP